MRGTLRFFRLCAPGRCANRWVVSSLLLLLAASTAGLARASGATLAAEAQLAGGYDSNAFEAVTRDRHAGDHFTRVALDLQRTPPPAARGGLLVQARWAADQYLRYRSQDRHLLGGHLGWRVQRPGLTGQARYQVQLVHRQHADSLSFHRHHFGLAAAVPLGRPWRLSWSADAVWVRTSTGGPVERRTWRLGGELQRALTPRWLIGARLEGGQARFEEAAIGGWRNGENPVLPERHQDRILFAGVEARWRAQPMILLAYGLREIDSNSFGYSQVRHEVLATLAWLLPARISLQLVARWQEPDYREEGYMKWRLRDDPEDPDLGARSGLTLQLRRPLAGGFAAEIQGAWHHNEARVSGETYEKVQIVTALRYGPPTRP